jgi:deazaflavin-dependent oxidoreductase (nitroreductase family)
MGMGVIELTTRGHRSGSVRAVLLSYLDSPDGPLVAGTNAGLDRDPAWVQNLRAEPQAEFATRAGARLVTANFLAGADHDDAWSRFQAADAQYARYAAMLTRPVPIVRFEVRKDGGSQ